MSTMSCESPMSRDITSAQLASHNANNSLTIEGPVLSVAPRHAKVRRDGDRSWTKGREVKVELIPTET